MQANRIIVKMAKLVYYQNTGFAAIKITFPYSPMTVNDVRTLEGRKFNGMDKANPFWTAPATIENIEKLAKFNFTIDPELATYYNTLKNPVAVSVTSTIPGLKCNLFPYQQEGVRFIEQRNGRAIVADEMGLGKTVQALAWLQTHTEKRPAIIVVPASLKLNWEKEAYMWLSDPKVQVLSGTTIRPIFGEIIVINYDIMPAWLGALQATQPKVVIMDEVHYIKNNSTQRTKAVKQLCKGVRHVIALSGTPIVNRPIEFYNAINIVDPTFAPSSWLYAHRYCGAKNNGFGWDFSGASNTAELHTRLTNTIMIRRKKADVLKDLPEKSYNRVMMELSNEKEYRYAERNFIDYLRNTKGDVAAMKASAAETLTAIEGLKQLAAAGKMNASVEWISNFLESGEKLVVMATHKAVIDRLMAEFSGIAVKLDGSTPPTERQAVVDAFQNNAMIRLFIGNIKAAGVGITLTASSNVAFLELPWTPGELGQAEDRVHRIGQKNAVMVWYLLTANTIETKIARLLDSKKGVLDSVLDGAAVGVGSIFAELLAEY